MKEQYDSDMDEADQAESERLHRENQIYRADEMRDRAKDREDFYDRDRDMRGSWGDDE